jgi:hypothetical protein
MILHMHLESISSLDFAYASHFFLNVCISLCDQYVINKYVLFIMEVMELKRSSSDVQFKINLWTEHTPVL